MATATASNNNDDDDSGGCNDNTLAAVSLLSKDEQDLSCFEEFFILT